jgi:hypothetical protein
MMALRWEEELQLDDFFIWRNAEECEKVGYNPGISLRSSRFFGIDSQINDENGNTVLK